MCRNIIATCVSVLVVFCAIGCRPVSQTRLPQFAEDVKRDVDPSELQTWAVSLLAAQKHEVGEVFYADEVLPDVRSLSSQGSPFQWAVCDKESIWLTWGGGFGHWGIVVGTASFKPQQEGNYYIAWEPGIYFWHEP